MRFRGLRDAVYERAPAARFRVRGIVSDCGGVFYVSQPTERLIVEIGSCLRKSLVHVRDKVGDFFDADGEADQAVGDPAGLTDFPWDRGVGHDRRVVDQRLDAAEGLGKPKDLETVAAAGDAQSVGPTTLRKKQGGGRRGEVATDGDVLPQKHVDSIN